MKFQKLNSVKYTDGEQLFRKIKYENVEKFLKRQKTQR